MNQYTVFIFLIATVIQDLYKLIYKADNNTRDRLFTFVYLAFIFQIGKLNCREAK